MFHFLRGVIKDIKGNLFLMVRDFWIQIYYQGDNTEGDFFLYPQFDDQKKTIFYYAFDSFEQKQLFENLLKVSWVWIKTAFLISKYPQEDLANAVKNMDTSFFQAIPGIWPKSAKKIVLEMKGNFDVDVIQQMNSNQKYFTSILKTLKWLWYEPEIVKTKLSEYKNTITKENMSQVIKWVISNI